MHFVALYLYMCNDNKVESNINILYVNIFYICFYVDIFLEFIFKYIYNLYTLTFIYIDICICIYAHSLYAEIVTN